MTDKLVMNNLKTKDLPVMMKIVKELNLKEFLTETVDTVYNEDVPTDVLDELEGKDEEEQKEIIGRFKEQQYIIIVTKLLDQLIENYDRIHLDLEQFVANIYSITIKEVQDLDLDVFMECVYRLKEQEQLINFFKTALK